MKISESQLRKLIREELAEEPRPVRSFKDQHVALDAPTEQVPHLAQRANMDLSPLLDTAMNMGEQVAGLLKTFIHPTPLDAEWQREEVPLQISNAIMKAIRNEVSRIKREMQMENE